MTFLWTHSHLCANACFSRFFIMCTKIEQSRFTAETGGYIGSMIIPSTELSTGCGFLRTFCQEQEIARRERGFAEGAEANGVALIGQEKCPIEHQPKLQRASEKATQQFQIAHFGKSLPASGFEC